MVRGDHLLSGRCAYIYVCLPMEVRGGKGGKGIKEDADTV